MDKKIRQKSILTNTSEPIFLENDFRPDPPFWDTEKLYESTTCSVSTKESSTGYVMCNLTEKRESNTDNITSVTMKRSDDNINNATLRNQHVSLRDSFQRNRQVVCGPQPGKRRPFLQQKSPFRQKNESDPSSSSVSIDSAEKSSQPSLLLDGKVDEEKVFGFMMPTVASENKSLLGKFQHLNRRMSSTRSKSKISTGKMQLDRGEHKAGAILIHRKTSIKNGPTYKTFQPETINEIIAQVKSTDWTSSLEGFTKLIDFIKTVDIEIVLSQMAYIYQRLIDLIRSQRTHVSLAACQIAGDIFSVIKWTNRPEFDELVDALLNKTADSNKFVRRNANISLDIMISQVAASSSVRALCTKAPTHKNSFVRIAVARLLTCIVSLMGANDLLSDPSQEFVKKKVLTVLITICKDRCLEVRNYGLRIYGLLMKDSKFDEHLRLVLTKSEHEKLAHLVGCSKCANTRYHF